MAGLQAADGGRASAPRTRCSRRDVRGRGLGCAPVARRRLHRPRGQQGEQHVRHVRARDRRARLAPPRRPDHDVRRRDQRRAGAPASCGPRSLFGPPGHGRPTSRRSARWRRSRSAPTSSRSKSSSTRRQSGDRRPPSEQPIDRLAPRQLERPRAQPVLAGAAAAQRAGAAPRRRAELARQHPARQRQQPRFERGGVIGA